MTEPHVAGHSTHFLRRLERVEGEHLDLALLLYRTPVLVQEAVQHESIPDDADRVALSLDDPKDGPFVVVTREGRFVTCLARGMSVDDLPVLTRRRLDLAILRLMREVERRDAARARASEGPEVFGRLVEPMWRAGALLAREDFEAVARWEPLLQTSFTRYALRFESSIYEGHAALVGVTKSRWRPAHDGLLRAVSLDFWMWAHFFVLMNVGDARRRADALQEATEDPAVDIRAVTTVDAMWYGILSPTARALWAVARQARHVVPSLARAPVESSPLLRAMRDLPLVVVAHASPSARIEALRLLAQEPAEPNEVTERAWRSTFVPPMVRALEAPRAEALAAFDATARERAWLALRDREGLPVPLRSADDVPLDVARALCVSGTGSWLRDPRLLAESIVPALPWLAQADAAELFLPRPWADALRTPYRKEDGRALLDLLTAVLGGGPSGPVRAKPSVGRNDPCPCGSGAKYKRCCGASGKR